MLKRDNYTSGCNHDVPSNLNPLVPSIEASVIRNRTAGTNTDPTYKIDIPIENCISVDGKTEPAMESDPSATEKPIIRPADKDEPYKVDDYSA